MKGLNSDITPDALELAVSARTDQDTRDAVAALNAMRRAGTLDELWPVLIDYVKTIGADLLSYHHHAPEFAPDRDNVTVRTWGFPESWVEGYLARRQHVTDPITQVFAARVRPMRWSEVDALVPLTPAQQTYLDDLRSWMKGDGLGIPVFGPGGRHGYVGVGRTARDISDWDVLRYNRLHWVAENFHLRWCEIVLFSLPRDFTLDEREMIILEAMAIGTRDEIICGLVGAQLESVQRSIRTILRKMGVSDRPGAILRGIGAGLIKAQTAVV